MKINELLEYIEKRGDKWVVLGKHDTKKKARIQLAAIEINKSKK